MYRLENWIMVVGDPYKAPECQKGCLTGYVYGNPKFEDGNPIVTSTIIEINVRKGFAKTISGSEYILGKPHPEWVEWLKENDFTDTLEDLKNCERRLVINLRLKP
jgi:hypothetical protein